MKNCNCNKCNAFVRYCSVNLRDEAGKKKEQPVRRNGGSFGRAASLQVIHAVVKSGSRGGEERLTRSGGGRGQCIMQEVTPSVVLMAVRMLMMVWMMNFKVSFLLIVSIFLFNL